LSRSIASITAPTFLEIGRTMIRNLAWPMRIIFPLTILSFIPVLVILSRSGPPGPAFYLDLAGSLLFVVALLATLLVNVPLDIQMTRWSPATLPPNWEGMRDRWESYPALRPFASLAGLACAIASAIVHL